jgi:hypothetical protein
MLFALSDDEREQIGLGKALGHSIGAIADRPSEVDGLARTLPQRAAVHPQRAAERALPAASRRRSLSIAQAA